MLYTSKDLFTQPITNAETNPFELSLNNKSYPNPDKQAYYAFFGSNSIIVGLKNDKIPEPVVNGAEPPSEVAVFFFGINPPSMDDPGPFSIDDSIIVRNNYKTYDDRQNGHGNRFSQFADYQILSTGFQIESFGLAGDHISRDAENFVILEVHSVDAGHENERYIFAAGDVVVSHDHKVKDNHNRHQILANLSVDHFFLSAGLNNYNQKTTGVPRASDIRAFARDDSVIIRDNSVINKNLDSLSDSGLLVVNHAAGSNQPTRVLHSDFSLVDTGPKQTSTNSTTLGNVIYKNTRFDDNLDPGARGASSPDGANDVVFNATTLGSTQGVDLLGAKIQASFKSDVFNTSAGGGLESLGSGPGYADYFVLENFDPNNPSAAGTEHAIGTDTSVDRQYAFLRLASIQSSTPESELTRTLNSALGGYVAGLLNTETGNNALSINNDLASRGLTVDMNFNNGQSLSLGGSDNNAAFVDDDRFAATNGSATLVSAGLVESGIDSAIATKIDIPEYMQWGFFFGDVDASAAGTSHAHLASWVAGSVPSAADLPVTGSATYTGSAIGNVFNGTNSYVAAGTYSNTWDFAARRGIAQIQDFDGVNYNGITARENTSSQFVGALANDAGTREVGLQGSFVQNAGDAAAGVMGQFYIQNTDSDVYRAAGTFAADKQ